MTMTPYVKTKSTSPPDRPSRAPPPGPWESAPCIPLEAFSARSVKKGFEVSGDAGTHAYRVTARGTLVYAGASASKPLAQPPWHPIGGPVDEHYHFAYYGSGVHISRQGRLSKKWRGSWRSLARREEREEEGGGREGGGESSTHVVYISLPELVGHLLSLGVEARRVPGCLRRGKHGCVGLELPLEPKQWSGGWSVMKEGVVHVWVC